MNNTTSKGKFITFEGGEGSGKSTQSFMLYEHLLNKGISVIHTREMGGTEEAERMRDIMLNGQLLPMSELLLIMAARYEHLNKLIIPALLQNKWVICDRFIDSTIAYQGGIQQITTTEIYNLHRKLISQHYSNINTMPDITFFINVAPEIAMMRIATRKIVNRFDAKNLNFHRNIHRRFLTLSRRYKNRIKRIDGTLSKEEVHQLIVSAIDHWLNLDNEQYPTH